MYKEKYIEMYIDCYNKIIDIVSLSKDFLYPDEYEIQRFKKNMTNEDKIEYIKGDLESVSFEKNVNASLLEVLEYFYPDDDKEYTEDALEELEEEAKDKLYDLYDKLVNKYFPFIKQITIRQYPDVDNKKLNDEDIWKIALKENVDELEDRVDEIIWTIMDSRDPSLVDKILKDIYFLDDIEFNRYTGSKNGESNSILKSEKPKKMIDCDFQNFSECFEDIFGQKDAIRTIEKVLKRSVFLYNAEDIVKTKRKNGPLATFMFYGPTGTGKTESAKRIAEFMYNNDKKMLILDMNSYKDGKIGSSALKGHPEGYVNSEKGTDFTRFLKKNEQGIIVLDEFEKADPEVREIFMTMLDEGEFKDALGNIYDLSSYVFIATTNASERFEKKSSIGFGKGNEKEEKKQEEIEIKNGLREIFTAPIMNRFNNLVYFKKIEYDDAIIICKSIITKMCQTFENKRFKGITPKITVNNIDEIAKIILKECNYEKDGVRSVKNVVNDLIGSYIIEEILDKNANILVDYKDDKIIVQKNWVIKR